MEKAYEHNKFEDLMYQKWEEAQAFEPSEKGEPFTIIMPPPNANDPLHVGHAMFVALEDILIRYHRMKGEAALWLPGTDHAGIETQFVFEKKLAKQDKSRFDFDRETLYQMIWDYVQENSGVAVNQMKKLGASADWSRFKFTLDPDIVTDVLSTFQKLHDDKLVYRGERLVNYCVKCGTGYSELEVEYEEREDALYFVRYEKKDTPGEYIVVATVRPEPIFADTHLAVNPKDKKNKALTGSFVLNPMTGAEMEIIGDEFVDPEFGTGIVKLTPAHDPNDYEVAKKHNLPIVQAITKQGKLTDAAGVYAGLRVLEARKQIVAMLTEKGLIEKTDAHYKHRVGTCYRCHSVIEPLLIPQFFVKTEPLAKAALASIDSKEVTVLGAGREKILRDWLTNLRDWNISRQIVWGIRIPVWYKAAENPDSSIVFLNAKREKIIGRLGDILESTPLSEIKAGLQSFSAPTDATFVISTEDQGAEWIQETDTFDTWFSSGQWPMVTLKANKDTDFERFYPTSVMETGYDILTHWVMRMMLLCTYATGKAPFSHVYLHGLVRDQQGRKMSKSIGNVINPLDMVEKYGADALRMALVMGSTPGQDKSVGEQTIKGMRNFSNKIWNAARYAKELHENTDNWSEGNASVDSEATKRIKDTTEATTRLLDDLKIGQAAEFIYSEFWHWFCDELLEAHKKKEVSTKVFMDVFQTFMRLLHPFAPFVTEAAYQQIYASENNLLITQDWPR